MSRQIPASELPLQGDGAIYHLDLHPHELADNVILVGDPGRVPLISGMFDTVEMFKQNRELITHTGTYKGKRISVISTGMGTDNIDIVLTELDALANVDLSTRTVKKEHRALNLVRIGTSGAFNPNQSAEPSSRRLSGLVSTVCCAIMTLVTSFGKTWWRPLSVIRVGTMRCPVPIAPPVHLFCWNASPTT